MFRIFDVNDSGLVLEWHEFFIPSTTQTVLPLLYNFLKRLRSKSLTSVSDKWLTKQLREIWLEIGFHHSLRNVNGPFLTWEDLLQKREVTWMTKNGFIMRDLSKPWDLTSKYIACGHQSLLDFAKIVLACNFYFQILQ